MVDGGKVPTVVAGCVAVVTGGGLLVEDKHAVRATAIANTARFITPSRRRGGTAR
jgi:hypothetical protein